MSMAFFVLLDEVDIPFVYLGDMSIGVNPECMSTEDIQFIEEIIPSTAGRSPVSFQISHGVRSFAQCTRNYG
jgi:hypothetical protein